MTDVDAGREPRLDQGTGETQGALGFARKAHDLAPEFVPAALHCDRCGAFDSLAWCTPEPVTALALEPPGAPRAPTAGASDTEASPGGKGYI